MNQQEPTEPPAEQTQEIPPRQRATHVTAPLASVVLSGAGLVLTFVWTMQLNPMPAAAPLAVPGIIAGVVGLVRNRRLRGRLLASVGIALGAVGLFSDWAAYQYSLDVTEIRRQSVCQAHLSGISKALMMYAHENADTMPPSLEHLANWKGFPEGYSFDARMLKCPSVDGKRACDYFYLPPAKDAPMTTLVACDLKGNHKGEGRSVIYAGFNVAFRPTPYCEEDLRKPVNAAFAQALAKAEGP